MPKWSPYTTTRGASQAGGGDSLFLCVWSNPQASQYIDWLLYTVKYNHRRKLNTWMWVLSWPIKIEITVEELIKHNKQFRREQETASISPVSKALLQGKEGLSAKKQEHEKNGRLTARTERWVLKKSSHRFHPWYSFSPCLGKGGRYKTVCADQLSIELSHRAARIMVTTVTLGFSGRWTKILWWQGNTCQRDGGDWKSKCREDTL